MPQVGVGVEFFVTCLAAGVTVDVAVTVPLTVLNYAVSDLGSVVVVDVDDSWLLSWLVLVETLCCLLLFVFVLFVLFAFLFFVFFV